MTSFLQYESANVEAFVFLEKGLVTAVSYFTLQGKKIKEVRCNRFLSEVEAFLKANQFRLVSNRYANEEVTK